MVTSALLKLSAACLALTAATAAGAQTAPSEQPADAPGIADEEGISEIIVTAQRREERLRDVPVAVTALSGDLLQDRDITTLNDVQRLAPSLAFGRGPQIRGVGTGSFSRNVEASVSTVIDDVVINRSFSANNNLFDIERVEVLRGPQGMLFGKNSTAGVVSIVTRRPVFGETSASVYATYDDRDSAVVQAVANAPLGTDAAIRLNAYVNRSGAYGENLFTGREFGSVRERGVKAKLLFQLGDTTDLYIVGDYTDADSDGPLPVAAAVLTAGGGSSYATINATTCGLVISARNRDICQDGRGEQRTNVKAIQGTLNQEIGDHNATAVLAWRKSHIEGNALSDSLPIDVLNVNSSDADYEQFTAELRLASPGDGPLQYVLGAFYLDDSGDPSQDQGGQFARTVFALPAGQRYSGGQRGRIDSRSIAGFGQATVTVVDSLRLIAGVRYTRDELSYSAASFTAPGARPLAPVFPPFVFPKQDVKNGEWSWRLGPQWIVSPELTTYFTVSRGYKGPAFNEFSNVPGRDPRIRPETVMNYELGIKASLLDRRLDVNIALFDQTFDDFQAEAFDQSTIPPAFRTINAGELTSRGVELEYFARPVTGLSIVGGFTYLDAKYREFLTSCYSGQTAAQGCVGGVFDAAGQRLGAPRFTMTTTVNYEAPVSGDLNGFVQGEYLHRSGFSTSAAGDPGARIDGYDLLGARLGVRSDEGWSVFLFARNLTNELYQTAQGAHPVAATFGILSGAPQRGYYTSVLGEPRTFGGGVSFEF